MAGAFLTWGAGVGLGVGVGRRVAAWAGTAVRASASTVDKPVANSRRAAAMILYQKKRPGHQGTRGEVAHSTCADGRSCNPGGNKKAPARRAGAFTGDVYRLPPPGQVCSGGRSPILIRSDEPPPIEPDSGSLPIPASLPNPPYVGKPGGGSIGRAPA